MGDGWHCNLVNISSEEDGVRIGNYRLRPGKTAVIRVDRFGKAKKLVTIECDGRIKDAWTMDDTAESEH